MHGDHGALARTLHSHKVKSHCRDSEVDGIGHRIITTQPAHSTQHINTTKLTARPTSSQHRHSGHSDRPAPCRR